MIVHKNFPLVFYNSVIFASKTTHVVLLHIYMFRGFTDMKYTVCRQARLLLLYRLNITTNTIDNTIFTTSINFTKFQEFPKFFIMLSFLIK